MSKKRVCMACDTEVGENDKVCPKCGVDLEFFAVSVEDKKKALDEMLSSIIGEDEMKEEVKPAEPSRPEVFDLSELEEPIEKKPQLEEPQKIEQTTSMPPTPLPPTPSTETLTPDKELSLKTAEAKSLMTAATRIEAELSAPRSYIAQGVQFAKRGDIHTALRYLTDAISLLQQSAAKRLNELLDNIERKIALLERHGSNMSRERKMLTAAREAIARLEIIEAVNIYDNLREMLGIPAKPSEKSQGEIERVMDAMEKYGLDVREMREKYEAIMRTATPSQIEKFKAEMSEEMSGKIYREITELGRVLVEKKYSGANVKNLAAILKQATIAFKRKQYLEALRYMESFKKLAGYTPIPERAKPMVGRKEEGERFREPIKLLQGDICFLNTNNVSLAYALAADFLKRENVLIITTTYPERLKKGYGLERAKFLFLTDSYAVEERYDIRRLDFEVIYEISNFLAEQKAGLILIDDLELMALYNGTEAIMNFLKAVIDKVMQNNATLLVSADLNTFSKKDGGMLRSLFGKVLDRQEDLPIRELNIGFEPVLGRSYLVETNTTSIEIIRNLARGRKALIITKNFPKKLKEDPRLTGAEIYWFTESEGYENLLRPSRLEFEVIKTILDFMRESHGLVFFDGLANALLSNDFKAVVDFLKAIDDENAVSGSNLIVEIAPGSLEKEKMRIIEERFDEVLRY